MLYKKTKHISYLIYKLKYLKLFKLKFFICFDIDYWISCTILQKITNFYQN